MTLDELRRALAPRIAVNAGFDGWTDAALGAAAGELGVSAAAARLAFPGGAVDMIDAWLESIDVAMLAAFPAERIAALKVRERIYELIMFTKVNTLPEREAVRRALALLARPQNVAAGARLVWRGSDRIWRLAGDKATDFNHYSKRAILGSIYAATTLVWIDDASEDLADTRAFLRRRIDEVMRFEKTKAGWAQRRENLPSLTRFLGRLRYPVV